MRVVSELFDPPTYLQFMCECVGGMLFFLTFCHIFLHSFIIQSFVVLGRRGLASELGGGAH